MESKVFVCGENSYRYSVIRQARKTLSVTVYPDKRIVVRCPQKLESKEIDSFLKKKSTWLRKKMIFLEQENVQIAEKSYVSGGKFFYRGREYLLSVLQSNTDLVTIASERLWVYTTNSPGDESYNQKLIDDWFRQQADDILRERFNALFWGFDYPTQPKLKISPMTSRWGSCSSRGSIHLNSKLVEVAADLIDYVIMHELCHLIEHNHSSAYYKILDEKMPDWKARKKRLDLIVI